MGSLTVYFVIFQSCLKLLFLNNLILIYVQVKSSFEFSMHSCALFLTLYDS